MKNLLYIGRCFFGIGIAGIGLQQFIYSEFRLVLMPHWPTPIPGIAMWAYVAGAILILAGILIALSIKVRMVSVTLGVFLLLLFLCFQVYYQLFLNQYGFHLGLWTDPLKELALSGGAFIVAVSGSGAKVSRGNETLLITGRIFLSFMLIIFGVDHFLYTTFVASLVPNWIPGHIFWTYFAAIALIGSGICIMFKIKIRLVSMLLGIMLFLWFIMLHIPRAIAPDPATKGNELTSVFEALALSGVAFIIACIYNKRVSLTPAIK